MKLYLYDLDGKKTSSQVTLSDDVFSKEPNDHAIYQAVRLEDANRRQGTHMTKNRAMVAGGGRKPFRQKGTGRARQGTIRAPQMRGGGRVFGPSHIRDYGFRLPKKVKRLARLSALSYKAREKAIIVVKDFTFDKPDTKKIIDLMNSFNLSNKKTLLITAALDRNLVKSADNVYGVNIRNGIQFSTRDLLYASTLIIQKSAVQQINEVFGK
jgi:large subunit ribosomal protein L4